MGLIEELSWRGLIHDKMPGTEEYLKDNMAIGYVGFDPTAVSLGIGNLVPIMLLVHLQRHGHKPIALVGGATGMVGDPSGKSAERNLLDEETLNRNLAGQKKQLERFLDFDCGENSAVIVNNYDWFKDFNLLDFLRDVGKHLTVSYMMAKDSVKTRMESGISFTEFTYQLIQGYDFLHLYQNHNCRLQMGGSDQWGNMTTGTELIGRMADGKAYALTCPLITRSDGKKFGKSEKGNLYLDPEMTSPYEFYQFWVQLPDADAGKMLKIFSLKNREEIEGLIAQGEKAPQDRIPQKALADELTERIHGAEALTQVKEATKRLHSSNSADIKSMTLEEINEVMQGVPQGSVEGPKLAEGIGVLELMVSVGASASNGDARRKITKDKCVKINDEKILDPFLVLNKDNLINEQFMLIQVGKKKKYIVKVD